MPIHLFSQDIIKENDFIVNIEHWDINRGLPSFYIHNMFQDSKGLVWLGGAGYLATFDGYDFREATEIKPTKGTAPIAEDVNGNIWFLLTDDSNIQIRILNKATNEVLDIFDYIKDLNPKHKSETWNLRQMENNKIWFHNDKGEIFTYDGILKPRQTIKDYSTEDMLFPIGEELIIIQHYEKSFKAFKVKNGERQLISEKKLENYFSTFWIDNQLTIWGVTGENFKLDLKNQLQDFQLYRIEQDKVSLEPLVNLNHTNKTKCGRFSKNNILINKDGIVLVRQPEVQFLYDGQLIPVDLNAQLEKYADDIYVENCYLIDEQAFFITTNHGLFSVKVQKNKFKHLLTKEKATYSMRGLLVAKDGKLYANNYLGAKIIDTKTGKYTDFEYPYNTSGLTFLEEEDFIWTTTHGGRIYKKDKKNGEHKEIKSASIPINNISSILKIKENEIWVGAQDGLVFLDTSIDSLYKKMHTDISFFSMYMNEEGVWAGTDDSLILLDKEGQILKKHTLRHLDDDQWDIHFIHEDNTGDFWLATLRGLVHWERKSNKFNWYTKKDGLSNNTIHAIYEDKKGKLWMPSNYGLMYFNKATKVIKTYLKQDGLSHSEFNKYSHHQDDKGTLYFGGLNGINFFDPNEIEVQDEKKLNLSISNCTVIDANTGKKSKKHIDLQKNTPISLSVDDNYLELSVSPHLYQNANNIEYAWRTAESSNDFIVQKSNLIQLNNILHGTNTIQIKARTVGSAWPDEVTEFSVFRKLPFYKMWWFYLLCLIVMVNIIFIISKYRNHRLVQAKRELEQEVQKRTIQIEAQAEELKQLDQLKNRFFSNVAHELRTPLTLIMLPLKDVLSKNNLTDSIRQPLSNIQTNVKKLFGLTEEILDVMRMENQTLPVKTEVVSIKKKTNDIVHSFSSLAAHRNISLEIEYLLTKKLTILIDSKKYEKILNNLISNALKYSSTGSVIHISISESEDNMLLEVKDTGQGIHQDDIPFVFDRFYQSKHADVSKEGGTGIGLSLSKEYAKLMEGTLEVYSIFGKGSSFIFTFPKKVPDTRKRVKEKVSVSKEQLVTANNKAHTILIVEDNLEMSNYIFDILAPLYNVYQVDNGVTALKKLEDKKIDLILSDIMMPEMDGFELLEAIKQHTLWQQLPVILLTAKVETEDKVTGLRLGVDDYMTKPFSSEELLARIDNLLVNHQVRVIENNTSPIAAASNSVAFDFEPVPTVDEVWLNLLETTVKSNIDETSFNVQVLATKMNISERNLRTKIKSNTGLSPNNYIKEARLSKARFLLESKAYSTVSEICYKVGFKHPANFTVIFKKRYGKLPSEYFE